MKPPSDPTHRKVCVTVSDEDSIRRAQSYIQALTSMAPLDLGSGRGMWYVVNCVQGSRDGHDYYEFELAPATPSMPKDSPALTTMPALPAESPCCSGVVPFAQIVVFRLGSVMEGIACIKCRWWLTDVSTFSDHPASQWIHGSPIFPLVTETATRSSNP